MPPEQLAVSPTPRVAAPNPGTNTKDAWWHVYKNAQQLSYLGICILLVVLYLYFYPTTDAGPLSPWILLVPIPSIAAWAYIAHLFKTRSAKAIQRGYFILTIFLIFALFSLNIIVILIDLYLLYLVRKASKIPASINTES